MARSRCVPNTSGGFDDNPREPRHRRGFSDVKYFRLKFSQQEIALHPGEVTIGRSPSCTVTIEDPLVSREHARLHITEETATFEDLASRNGSRINGALVYGATVLKDGDRLTVGKHEMLFLAVPKPPRDRATAGMRNCLRCRAPYPEGAGVCPYCESPDYLEDEPPRAPLSEPTWALDMLNEMVSRAMALGRPEHAERVLRRVMAHVEEQIEKGASIEREPWERLAASLRRALPPSKATPLDQWIASVHDRLGWAREGH